ncbi:MAG: 50S ribosomal protein L32 [Syntrophomonadaceae bacterium]|nr:50S ribosomal protein L32 [Syntrophomonadaceae bacterium]
MGVPARKRSKTRTSRRRAMQKISAPGLNECPQCHALKLPHRICSQCGYYHGREVQSQA